ncbi:small basic protein [bacterium]|nr:small basic protein [bacterium]MDB4393742.1 small basic protein [Rhodopirellula sp.]
MRKKVKDNILLLLQQQRCKISTPSFGLSELPMTMDSSLKVKAGAIRARNVLTRAERIARLRELDRFDEEASVVGMPKVRVVKVSLKKKKKVKKAEDEK